METKTIRKHRKGLGGIAAIIAITTAISTANLTQANAAVTLNAIFLPATWGTVVKDTLAPEYEKLTGVKVNVQLIGRDEIHQKMGALFAAQDSSYDIFNLDYNWIPEFGRAGYLVPLDNALSAADKADFLPQAMAVGTYNKQLLGIPQTIHPALLWYRSDLYNDAKIKAQFKKDTGAALVAPTTMKAWEQQAAWFNGKTLNGSKVYGWAAQAAKGYGNVHTWLSFAYSFGCEPLNATFTKSQISTPNCLKATNEWNKMMKLMPPGANDFTYDSVTQAAQQGTIATAIQWSWGAFATDIPDASKTVGKWSFTQIPAGVGTTGVSHLAEWVISLSKFSKNQEEAKKFIAWLETKNNDVKQASLGGGDPVRISSYSNATLTGEKLAGTSIDRFRRYPSVLKAMEKARPRPFFPGEEAWETLLSSELSAISLGQKTVAKGSSAADSTINKFLKG
jgi:hypothetical protein